jgi:hypothetical protein
MKPVPVTPQLCLFDNSDCLSKSIYSMSDMFSCQTGSSAGSRMLKHSAEDATS